jgi:hypothetical protein
VGKSKGVTMFCGQGTFNFMYEDVRFACQRHWNWSEHRVAWPAPMHAATMRDDDRSVDVIACAGVGSAAVADDLLVADAHAW